METNERLEKVSLTQNEIISIDDRLTLLSRVSKDNYFEPMRGLGSNAEMPSEPELILKLGSALLVCVDENIKEAEINFTEKELWLLREMTNSGIIFGKEQVGLNLKIKIHRALRNISNDFINEEFIEATDLQDKTKNIITKSNILHADNNTS